MNLKYILDGKKDYKGLSERYPDNFYFCLAEKLAKLFTTANKSTASTSTLKVFGNSIQLKMAPSMLALQVDGKWYKASDPSFPALEQLIYDIYQDDLKGAISIDHKGSSAARDRADFNKAHGTLFPRLFKDVKFTKQGTFNPEVSQRRSDYPVLTQRQFENASTIPSFKQDNFTEYQVGNSRFYVNNKAKLVEVPKLFNGQQEGGSEEDFGRIIRNYDSNLDYWSRTPELSSISDYLDDYKTVVATYKDSVWLLVPESNYYSVTRVI